MGINFTVLGAGALGSLIGGRLADAGCNVHLIGREGHITAIKKYGLYVSGIRGEKKIKISASTSVKDIPFDTDVFIVSVKQKDTVAVIRSLNGQIDEDAILLSFQNGLPFREMMLATEKGLKLAAVTGWAATMEAPGKIAHTSDGEFMVGGTSEQQNSIEGSEKVKTMLEILNRISKSRISPNIDGHLWTKLLIASIYSVFAVGGMSFGDVMGNPLVKKIMLAVWREGYSVAKSLNIQLEIYLGQLVPEMLVSNCFEDFMRAGYIIDLMLKDRKHHRPSVLLDLESERPTEIPYLNGTIVREGVKNGIKTPMNEALIQMIYEIEKKKRQIKYSNINILNQVLIFGKAKSRLGE